MPNKLLFIVNPVAGGKSKTSFADLIGSLLGNDLPYRIVCWEKPDQDLKSLIFNNIETDTDVVVAVGGDGTINKIASVLINTDLALGIIPMGSGNGIARHLGIPINPEKAIGVLKTGNIINIDVCKMNKKYYVTTAGVGFDAYVSRLFHESAKRGFITYILISLRALFSYKQKKYTLQMGGEKIKEKAFLITFANASQWGNNVFIAPDASLHDGMLDVVIIKKPDFFNIFTVSYKLLNKTINNSRFVKTIRTNDITLIRKKKGEVHYDGESDVMKKKIRFQVIPDALKVIVP
jgi:diacylglycerol kinase (ATP)